MGAFTLLFPLQHAYIIRAYVLSNFFEKATVSCLTSTMSKHHRRVKRLSCSCRRRFFSLKPGLCARVIKGSPYKILLIVCLATLTLLVERVLNYNLSLGYVYLCTVSFTQKYSFLPVEPVYLLLYCIIYIHTKCCMKLCLCKYKQYFIRGV